jgi:peptidoglycan hydrolase CwlO-like protein
VTIDTFVGVSVSLAILFGGWCVRLEVHRQMISERLRGVEERAAESRSHQEADRTTLNSLNSQIAILSSQIKTLTSLNAKLEEKIEKLVDPR